jgi:hypothetical protein
MDLTMRRKPPAAAVRAGRRSRSGNGINDVPATAVQRSLAPRLKPTRLDLLPILHELQRTRSVTQTARSLGITQPAVSSHCIG